MPERDQTTSLNILKPLRGIFQVYKYDITMIFPLHDHCVSSLHHNIWGYIPILSYYHGVPLISRLNHHNHYIFIKSQINHHCTIIIFQLYSHCIDIIFPLQYIPMTTTTPLCVPRSLRSQQWRSTPAMAIHVKHEDFMECYWREFKRFRCDVKLIYDGDLLTILPSRNLRLLWNMVHLWMRYLYLPVKVGDFPTLFYITNGHQQKT